MENGKATHNVRESIKYYEICCNTKSKQTNKQNNNNNLEPTKKAVK